MTMTQSQAEKLVTVTMPVIHWCGLLNLINKVLEGENLEPLETLWPSGVFLPDNDVRENTIESLIQCTEYIDEAMQNR